MVVVIYDPERAKNLIRRVSYSDIQIILKNPYQNIPSYDKK